jgi:NTP pyrophosphatase (non-canonical NTP hydrolase)
VIELNDKENELFTILGEECGEVIVAMSKIKRFGVEGNLTAFKQELADVQALIDIAMEYGIMDNAEFSYRVNAKREKLKKYSNL